MLPGALRRGSQLCVLACVFVFAPAAVAKDIDSAAVSEEGTPNEDALHDAELFRSQLGLRDDASIVSASLVESSEFSNHDYGVPLRPDEAAQVKGLVSAQSALLDVVELAPTLPGFATEYFDGATLHILVFGDAAPMAEAVVGQAQSG